MYTILCVVDSVRCPIHCQEMGASEPFSLVRHSQYSNLSPGKSLDSASSYSTEVENELDFVQSYMQCVSGLPLAAKASHGGGPAA